MPYVLVRESRENPIRDSYRFELALRIRDVDAVGIKLESPMTALGQHDSIPAPASGETTHYTGALVTVTTLFFMWGFLTALNDILVPHLKSIFNLNYGEVMLIQFSFFPAYFVFSIPSGMLIDRTGYKRAMVAALAFMGLGAAMFVPAASVPPFPLLLAALIVLAAGITLLQVAANPYVTVLGPAKSSASRLNLTQAFNSLGTTVAPYLGSLYYALRGSRPMPPARA